MRLHLDTSRTRNWRLSDASPRNVEASLRPQLRRGLVAGVGAAAIGLRPLRSTRRHCRATRAPSHRPPVGSAPSGRIAQLARALPLQGRCRRFESVCAHVVAALLVGAGAAVLAPPAAVQAPRKLGRGVRVVLRGPLRRCAPRGRGRRRACASGGRSGATEARSWCAKHPGAVDRLLPADRSGSDRGADLHLAMGFQPRTALGATLRFAPEHRDACARLRVLGLDDCE